MIPTVRDYKVSVSKCGWLHTELQRLSPRCIWCWGNVDHVSPLDVHFIIFCNGLRVIHQSTRAVGPNWGNLKYEGSKNVHLPVDTVRRPSGNTSLTWGSQTWTIRNRIDPSGELFYQILDTASEDSPKLPAMHVLVFKSIRLNRPWSDCRWQFPVLSRHNVYWPYVRCLIVRI